MTTFETAGDHSEETGGTPAQLNVSVVVVARNEAAKIGACMRALAAQSYPGQAVEVILVDDGSTDRTVELATAALPGLRVVSNPSQSISANRNRGWRAARHPYVAFIDADCVAPPDWLANLVAAMQASGAAAVGGGNRPPAGVSRFYDALAICLDSHLGSAGSVQGRVFGEPREVPHLPGLNVLFDKAALALVDGYDERFRLIGEDADLCMRLRDVGARLLYTPEATVAHWQRGDLAAWSRNMFTYGKGRIWLARRHPSHARAAHLLPLLLPMLLPVYLPVVMLAAIARALQAGRLGLTPEVFAIYVATHLPYALGQWYGLFVAGDAPQARGRRRLGVIVLRNAGNKGDEAIFLSFCRRLLAHAGGTNLDVYAAGLGPSGFSLLALPRSAAARERLAQALFGADLRSRQVQTDWRRLFGNALALLYMIGRFDAVVIGGGQWLHDLSLRNHVVVSGLFALARLCGTARGIFAIGAGPLRRRISRRLTRLALGGDSLLVVRDRRSAELLQACGLGEAGITADPALELEAAAAAPPLPAPFVGVTPCAWFRFENIYRRDRAEVERSIAAWRRLLGRIAEAGYGVVLLPTMNPEDLEYAERLLQELPAGTAAHLVDTRTLAPGALQAIVAQCAAYVSMRLHPLIFCLNSEVPFVALNYAEKVAQFCRDLDLDSCRIDIDDDNWHLEAGDKLLELLANRSSVSATLAEGHARERAKLDPAYDALFAWLDGRAG